MRCAAVSSLVTIATLLASCGGGAATPDGPVAAAADAPPAPADARPPDAPQPAPDANVALLSQAGLYASFAARTPEPRLRPYEVQFALWADGLGKRRFLDLPAGSQIDTSDLDHWDFPVGTRLWKEFGLADGTPLETRLLERLPDGSWQMGAYVWRADGSDADYRPLGATAVRGTDHDVPSEDQCQRCHLGEPGRVLGFSAVQLGDVEVQRLAAAGLLSAPPRNGQSLALPWDGATDAALGLLHGNCGHCHNPGGSAATQTSLILRLTAADLAQADRAQTVPWRSLVGVPTQGFMVGKLLRVAPHDRAGSAVLVRMGSREAYVLMPPLGTAHVDGAGVALVGAWVDSL